MGRSTMASASCSTPSRHGRRHSAYAAFVKPVLGRKNLTVRTGCHVQRVLFAGRAATGVEVLHNGRSERIAAAREVILSGGAINTPQLLMLSGIGPGAELHRHGIPVRHDVPGIGQNLQDHFYVHTGWRATAGSSYNASLVGLRKYWEGLKYLVTRRGYLALGSSQVAAFVKSSPAEGYADLQISFRPMTFQYFPDGTVRGGEPARHGRIGLSVAAEDHGYGHVAVSQRRRTRRCARRTSSPTPATSAP